MDINLRARLLEHHSIQIFQAMADVQNNLPVTSNASLKHFESQRPEKDTLITQLDELLERYLITLNEHEKIRQELSKQLSSVSTLTN